MKPQKIKSREAAEESMAALATATYRRDKIEAHMNLQLAAVREKFEAELATLADEIKTEEKRLRDWADSNPGLFAPARSLRLTHGTIGYRLGNWAVKLIRGFKSERAVALVKSAIGPAYVRVREELDKELILADRAKLPPDTLAGCGIRLEQAEAFFATPEKTEAPQ